MKKINNQKKALIHVAKSKVGLSDVEYRDLLASVGVETSKDLNASQFRVVMDRFRDLGFTSKPKKKAGPPNTKDRMIYKIDQVLDNLGLSRAYANGMANKMYKLKRLEWCNTRQLKGIISALTYHQRRKAGNE